MELSKLFGLPAHPLLVHIPVVLIPLAALGTLAIVASSGLRARIGWYVAGIAVFAAIGAGLAAGAGESLQENVRNDPSYDPAAVSHHAELGDAARGLAIAFAIVVVVYVALDWWIARTRRQSDAASVGAAMKAPPTWLRKWGVPLLAIASITTATLATVWVVQAGHTGAKATWERAGNGG